MTDFFLTARALTDLLGPISAAENARVTSADFAFGSSMTLLPGSQSLQLHIAHDDNDVLDDRSHLLHALAVGALVFPENSWLRPQFRVALRKSPIVLTIWRLGATARDEGVNALFTTSADFKSDHVYQIDPLDS